MREILKKLTSGLFEIIESMVVALTIFVAIYYALVQPHQVKGGSMDPTFHDGEFILTDKISYRFKQPIYGDIVVFKAPNNPDFDYIKRIVAVGGDTIMIKEGIVYLNNQKIEESYVQTETILLPGQYMKDGEPVTLQEGEYFVLGDNRSHSSDSRQWGAVTKKEIIGKVFFRYWPVNRFGLITKPLDFEAQAYQ